MRDLFEYSQQNPGLRPNQALSDLVATFAVQNQQGLSSNPQQPSGVRTPSTMPMNQAQVFAQQANPNFPNLPMGTSPNPTHLALPGSPHVGHTPSPAQNHIQAPGLAAQHSQQGSNNSGTSANTSPNVSNKRRRPSVKTEGDDGGGGGGEVNGTGSTKVKASPRAGGKRQKGNPA
jgi:hypothetical protein